jgi:hypothetical protein
MHTVQTNHQHNTEGEDTWQLIHETNLAKITNHGAKQNASKMKSNEIVKTQTDLNLKLRNTCVTTQAHRGPRLYIKATGVEND